jgi:hypothetical protein
VRGTSYIATEVVNRQQLDHYWEASLQVSL